MSTLGTALIAVVIAVGLVGIIVPVLPGGLLVFVAIAVWAVIEGGSVAWVTLGLAAALFVTAEVIKYTWPVRRMRAAEVSKRSLAAGAVLGVVGFFVIPVVGLVLGFVLGVFLVELVHRRDGRRAWASTVHALKGVALSAGVEFTGALLAALSWALAVLIF